MVLLLSALVGGEALAGADDMGNPAPLEIRTWSLNEASSPLSERPAGAVETLTVDGWTLAEIPPVLACAGETYAFRAPSGALLDASAVGIRSTPPAQAAFGPAGVFQLNTSDCTCCCASPNHPQLAMPHAGGVDVVEMPLAPAEPRCEWWTGLGDAERRFPGRDTRYDASTRTMYHHSVMPKCEYERVAGSEWEKAPVEEAPSAITAELFAVIRFLPEGIHVERFTDSGIPEAHLGAWDTAAPTGGAREQRTKCPPVSPLKPPAAGEDLPVADVRTSSPMLASSDDCLSYGASNLLDRRLDTSWQEAVDGDGVGEWLEFRFDAPVDIASVDLGTGFQSTHETYGDLFPLNGRVTALTVQVNGVDAGALALADKPGLQRQPFVHRNVTSVRLQIAGVAAGTKWPDTALSEVRFISP